MPTYHRRPLEQRFWEKVDKDGPTPQHCPERGPCWIWLGAKLPSGHGRIGSGGKFGRTIPSHRVSWEIHYGEIPQGLHVCHHCDYPPCQNPTHLFLGTNFENRKDSQVKGRIPKGEKHWAAKMTDEQIKLAISFYKAGISQAAIAKKFGVSQPSISTFVRGVRRNQ